MKITTFYDITPMKECMKEKGLSAIIYTEVSDVEDKLNGLLAYDCEVIKVSPEMMKAANEKLKF